MKRKLLGYICHKRYQITNWLHVVSQENIKWCLYEFQQFLPVAYEKSLNDTFLFCGYNIFSDCTTLHHEI